MDKFKRAPCETPVFVGGEAVVDVRKFVRLGILEAVVVPAAQYFGNSLQNWLEAYVLREVTVEVAAAL